MIKVEFPADNLRAAGVFGRALTDYSQGMKIVHNADATNTGPALSPDELQERLAEAAGEGSLSPDFPEVIHGTLSTVGKGASTATAPDGRAEATTHDSGDAVVSGGEPTVDINGLEFNGLYCGQAKEPFYGTGPRKGQWKKLRGVDDATYDRWYAETRAKNATPTPISEELEKEAAAVLADAGMTEPANTAAAFGNTVTAEPAPQTPGEFMGWTAERQAAGLLTQGDVEHIYHENGLGVTDLFGAHAPEVIAEHIATLHGHMVALIASRGTA
jgi:hypothetical protein